MRGKLLINESLARFTSWRVGGKAKQIYKPTDLDDLVDFLKALPKDEPLLWLGLGSNTLIRDGGYNGTIILTLGGLSQLEVLENNNIYAQAGVSCATMARFCARLGFEGAAFWAGIPGTIGGALRMNAGCHYHETWDFVKTIETIDRQGNCYQHSPSDYQIAYRSVKGCDDQFFTAATFEFIAGDKAVAFNEIRDLLKYRTDTQPTNEPSCGSVFRNPPNDHAARLIEACGLKGFCIGGAQVSEKHANFIVNNGNATAQDIENLISHVHIEVANKHRVTLVHEVHIIGDTL